MNNKLFKFSKNEFHQEDQHLKLKIKFNVNLERYNWSNEIYIQNYQ